MKSEERLARIERLLERQEALFMTVDSNRAYSDAQVCALLSISRSTLWRIRRGPNGKLKPTELIPGAAARTRGRQLVEFLDERERETNVIEFTGTGRRRSA
jgi:hypothetical protein